MFVIGHDHEVIDEFAQRRPVVTVRPHRHAGGDGGVDRYHHPLFPQAVRQFRHKRRQSVLVVIIDIFKVDIDAVQIVQRRKQEQLAHRPVLRRVIRQKLLGHVGIEAVGNQGPDLVALVMRILDILPVGLAGHRAPVVRHREPGRRNHRQAGNLFFLGQIGRFTQNVVPDQTDFPGRLKRLPEFVQNRCGRWISGLGDNQTFPVVGAPDGDAQQFFQPPEVHMRRTKNRNRIEAEIHPILDQFREARGFQRKLRCGNGDGQAGAIRSHQVIPFEILGHRRQRYEHFMPADIRGQAGVDHGPVRLTNRQRDVRIGELRLGQPGGGFGAARQRQQQKNQQRQNNLFHNLILSVPVHQNSRRAPR